KRRHHRPGQAGPPRPDGRTAVKQDFGRTFPRGGGCRAIGKSKAELARKRAMNWSQLKAIVWLRGRLSWNRFSRGGALNAIVAVIILASFIVGIICSAVAGFLAGYFALAHQRPQALLEAWDGIIIVFCLFWAVGLLAEIQRSESVDMAKLLHLP